MKPTSFHLKIEHLWGLAALVGIFVFVNTHPIRPQDFWWHIAIGREIASTGKIPTTDVFSFTEAGKPYPSYQMFWLMETALYELYRLGGPALVIFVHSLMISAAYLVIFWICKDSTKSWRIAALSVLLAAALGLNDWNVRPQGITFLLGSLLLLAIYRYRQDPRWYWLLIFPPVMLIWVNSHGTFLIGLVLIGLWCAQVLWEIFIDRLKGSHKLRFKPLIVPACVLVFAMLICLINPRGIGIAGYIQTLTSNTMVQNLVTEWAPPSLSTIIGVVFFCILLIYAILLAVSPKRPSFSQAATLIIFGLLGIKTSRGIVWFGLVMAPIIAYHLSAIMTRFQKAAQKPLEREGSRLVNLIFVIVIILMGAVSLPWFKNALPLPAAKAGLISSETPVQATQALLDQNPPGKIFNSMSFGSYLIWAAYPQYQVFVDTRIELFSEPIWMDYLNISNAYGDWEARLRIYGVNTLMLSPVEQHGLIEAALQSNGWKVVYQDNASVIFTRQ